MAFIAAFLGEVLTTAILIRARLVVQVHSLRPFSKSVRPGHMGDTTYLTDAKIWNRALENDSVVVTGNARDLSFYPASHCRTALKRQRKSRFARFAN
jgi:hypothetical protein